MRSILSSTIDLRHHKNEVILLLLVVFPFSIFCKAMNIISEAAALVVCSLFTSTELNHVEMTITDSGNHQASRHSLINRIGIEGGTLKKIHNEMSG